MLSAISVIRVLVTGGNGFLGKHVVALGRHYGAETHVLTSNNDKSNEADWCCGDLRDASRINRIIRDLKPEAIIHLAAGGVAYGTGSLEELLAINGGGLGNVLEAASKLKNAPSVVVAGSGFEYAPQERPLDESDSTWPTTAYGISKVAATLVANMYARRLPMSVLRLFSLYGPGEREPRLVPYVIQQAVRGLAVELTSGEQKRDYMFVVDAAEAFWKALLQPPVDGGLRIMNIASGHVTTLRKLIETLAEILRRNGLDPDLRFGAKPYRGDEMMEYTANTNLMRNILPSIPNTTLEAGLEATVKSSCD